jgi:hypothetical protein
MFQVYKPSVKIERLRRVCSTALNNNRHDAAAPETAIEIKPRNSNKKTARQPGRMPEYG